MKRAGIFSMVILWAMALSGIHPLAASAQSKADSAKISQHIGKLVLNKKKKKVFQNKGRDSTIIVQIDTLIMKDRASLQFYGLKEVSLRIGYAEIGKDVVISGVGSRNNASNFDIDVHLAKLQSMYVLARGIDAMNGTRTHPNGDGGDVSFRYTAAGLSPQQDDKKAKNYLMIDASAGGRRINPPTDVAIVMSRINMGGARMPGIPQGQVYSGSPGVDGKIDVSAKP